MKLLIVMFALVAAVFGFPSYQQQRFTFQQTFSPQYIDVRFPLHQPIFQRRYVQFIPPYHIRQPMPETIYGVDNSPTSERCIASNGRSKRSGALCGGSRNPFEVNNW